MSDLGMSAQSAASALTDGHRFPWRWNLADLAAVPKNGLKVFSCFSCGGGSSMGYKLAGYEVIGCCEIDPKMMAVYKANNHPRLAFEMDIRDLVEANFPPEMMGLDILDGSPPCSVFSMAGAREAGWNKEKVFREGQKKQRLDDLFFSFIELAEKIQPKVVVAENVKGLVLKNARGYVNEIVKAFREAGYYTQIVLLNSARMGVPQSRERVFFIAQREDIFDHKIKLAFNEPVINFGEVRTEHGRPLNPDSVSGKLAKYIRPSDRSLSDVAKRIRRKDAYFSTVINHDTNPLHTITASGQILRAYDRTEVSAQDIINCQTFPQDYNFLGMDPQYICGMSVPPVMMAHVAAEIAEQIFNLKIEELNRRREE